MSKVKQLADELYNQKVLDGWKNVSMETCLKRATDYYRNKQTKTKLLCEDCNKANRYLMFRVCEPCLINGKYLTK